MMALSVGSAPRPALNGLRQVVGIALLLWISGVGASARAASDGVVADCAMDIVLAVDVSMSTQRQQDERRRELSNAIGAFVDRLSPKIRLAMVSFGTGSDLVLPLRPLDADQRRALQAAADALIYRDQWTDIRLGLDTAFQVGNRERGRNTVIIFISDGDVSLKGGQDSEERSKLQIYDPLLPQITKQGIRVFGVAFKDGAFVLLNRVAESTKGLYRRALEPKDFTPILLGFASELCPKAKKPVPVGKDDTKGGKARVAPMPSSSLPTPAPSAPSLSGPTGTGGTGAPTGGGVPFGKTLLLIGGAFLASGIASFSFVRFRQLQAPPAGSTSARAPSMAGAASRDGAPFAAGAPFTDRASSRDGAAFASGVPFTDRASLGDGTPFADGAPFTAAAPGAKADPAWEGRGPATAAMVLPCAAHSQRPAKWSCASCRKGYCADCPGENRQPQRCDSCIAKSSAAAAPRYEDVPETELFEVPTAAALSRPAVPENAVLVAVWDKNRQAKLRHIQLGRYDDVVRVFGGEGALVEMPKVPKMGGRLRYQHDPSQPVVMVEEEPAGGFRNTATGEAIGRGYKFKNNVWIYWAQDPKEHQIEVVFK